MPNNRRHPLALRQAGVKPRVPSTPPGLGCRVPAQGVATGWYSSAHPFSWVFFSFFPEFQMLKYFKISLFAIF